MALSSLVPSTLLSSESRAGAGGSASYDIIGGMALTGEIVKAKARELGADGVGIADAAVLNAHPPDPAHPQIPSRISPEIRSCVAFFKRIPAGAFRARDNACIHHVDQLVLREMDRVGYRIARFLEEHGHWAFQTGAQETAGEGKSAGALPHPGARGGGGRARRDGARAESVDRRSRPALLHDRRPHRRRARAG